LAAAMARESAAMKIFTVMVAVAMLASIAMPVSAQFKKGESKDEKKVNTKQVKDDENAYKAALEKIPDPKDKYDPWGVARPADTAKKPK
jgi:hypothetical protein